MSCVLVWIAIYSFISTRSIPLLQLPNAKRNHLYLHKDRVLLSVFSFKDSTHAKNQYFRLVRNHYQKTTAYGVNDWTDNYIQTSSYTGLVTKVSNSIVLIQMPPNTTKEELESQRIRYLDKIKGLNKT